MKNKLFSCLLGIGLLFFNLESRAEIYSTTTTNLPAGLYSLIPNNSGGAGILTSLSINNTNAATVAALKFYDSPSANVTYVNAAYTNVTVTSVTITNTYTNVLDAISTNIYAGVERTLSSVAASTNSYTLLFPLNAASNAITTWNGSMPFHRGLAISNTASVTVTYTYEK